MNIRQKFVLIASAGLANGFSIGQTVQTTSGLVQGRAASNTPEVSEYLGIPFVRQVKFVLAVKKC
jgi:hypothetical protein